MTLRNMNYTFSVVMLHNTIEFQYWQHILERLEDNITTTSACTDYTNVSIRTLHV